MADRATTATRTLRIRAAHERGDSVEAIAREEGVSPPTVRKHLGMPRPSGVRLPLMAAYVVEAYLNYWHVTGRRPNSSLWNRTRAEAAGPEALYAFEIGWVSTVDDVHRGWPDPYIDVIPLGGWKKLPGLADVERERRQWSNEPLQPPGVPLEIQENALVRRFMRADRARGEPAVPPELLVLPGSPVRGLVATNSGPAHVSVPQLRHLAIVGKQGVGKMSLLVRLLQAEEAGKTSTPFVVLPGENWWRLDQMNYARAYAKSKPAEAVSLIVDDAEPLLVQLIELRAVCPQNLHVVAAWDPTNRSRDKILFAMLDSRLVFRCRDADMTDAYIRDAKRDLSVELTGRRGS